MMYSEEQNYKVLESYEAKKNSNKNLNDFRISGTQTDFV